MVNKNGKLSDRLADKIPWNKLCVDIIPPTKYTVIERIFLYIFSMIDPVMGWFEITQNENKTIDNNS